MPNQYPDEPFGRQPQVLTGAPGPASGQQAGAQGGAQAPQMTYDGQNVTVVRDAQDGDQGFKKNAGDQVLIRNADGSEQVVKKSDVQPAATTGL